MQKDPAQLALYTWAPVILGRSCHGKGRKAEERGADKGQFAGGWKGDKKAGKGRKAMEAFRKGKEDVVRVRKMRCPHMFLWSQTCSYINKRIWNDNLVHNYIGMALTTENGTGCINHEKLILCLLMPH